MRRKCLLTIFVVVQLFLSAFWHGAYAWQVEECFLTRNGFLAGSTPDNLNKGIEYEKVDRAKLDALINDGRVIRLKENIEVRVVERSVEFKMLEVKLPDRETPYWVIEGSISPIKKRNSLNPKPPPPLVAGRQHSAGTRGHSSIIDSMTGLSSVFFSIFRE